MKRTLFLGVLMVLCAAAAFAGPIDPGRIPGDAVWFAHLDMEKLHALPLYRACPVLANPSDKLAQKLKRLNEKIGLDLRYDLLDVTVFSTRYEGHVGAAIFKVLRLDSEKLLGTLLKKHPNHTTEEYLGKTLYSWMATRKKKPLIELTGALFNDQIVVIGADKEEVKHVLDVLSGQKPGLKDDSLLLRDMAPNAIWMANCINVPADYQGLTRCPVLRHCVSASARWWESQGYLMGRYLFKTISPEAARLFVQAVDGMKAMAALKFAAQSPILKLLEPLSYKADGPYFTLSWRGSLESIHQTAKHIKSHVKIIVKSCPDEGKPGATQGDASAPSVCPSCPNCQKVCPSCPKSRSH